MGFDYRYTGSSRYLFEKMKGSNIKNIYFVTNNELVPKKMRIKAKNQPEISYSKYPGTVPRKLPQIYAPKGIRMAPKYRLTASPGRQEMSRKKKEEKKGFAAVWLAKASTRGCFWHKRSVRPAPEHRPTQ